MAIPVTLEDAKAQLRVEIDDTERDGEITRFIEDAAGWVERYTGHILIARDVTEQFRGFGGVKLRAWPVKPTAVPAVAYLDTGVPASIIGARLDVTRRPARVLPPGHFYPFRDAQQLFTVTIRAGYEDGDVIPTNLRRAMLVLISGYDADREGGDAFQLAEATARKLCADYRARAL
ncbi:MAG TPA: phage head-tail connector protein [Sphingomonas sp.]|jgi:uncharacterized phiE125 gp8 family phage protein